jgi:hypothetical protein
MRYLLPILFALTVDAGNVRVGTLVLSPKRDAVQWSMDYPLRASRLTNRYK